MAVGSHCQIWTVTVGSVEEAPVPLRSHGAVSERPKGDVSFAPTPPLEILLRRWIGFAEQTNLFVVLFGGLAVGFCLRCHAPIDQRERFA